MSNTPLIKGSRGVTRTGTGIGKIFYTFEAFLGLGISPLRGQCYPHCLCLSDP